MTDDQLLAYIAQRPGVRLAWICYELGIPWCHSSLNPAPSGAGCCYTAEAKALRNQLQRLRRRSLVKYRDGGWRMTERTAERAAGGGARAMNTRLGHVQRDILRAVREGAELYQEDGRWCCADLDFEGSHPGIGASCRRLLARGLIAVSKTESHPFWFGGARTLYALTEQGRAAL